MVNSITLFALAILFLRNVWSLCANVTTIEGWEIERHETLLRRARNLGGCLDGPDGISVKITKQEFPYDVGILQNILQGLDGNVLVWLWPFARTPLIEHGFQFEVNGFEGIIYTSSGIVDVSLSQILRHPGRLQILTVFPDGQESQS